MLLAFSLLAAVNATPQIADITGSFTLSNKPTTHTVNLRGIRSQNGRIKSVDVQIDDEDLLDVAVEYTPGTSQAKVAPWPKCIFCFLNSWQAMRTFVQEGMLRF